MIFQSTLPVGGATSRRRRSAGWASYFNPRSPWGERQYLHEHPSHTSSISIHAPRGGSDVSLLLLMRMCRKFQSTLPVGGATLVKHSLFTNVSISIHAPRGGSDASTRLTVSGVSHFNPRSPWGERRGMWLMHWPLILFQSTLPVGGATSWMVSPWKE